MTSLIRWDPFEDRFEDLVRSFFRAPVAAVNGNGALSIKMDVSENDKTYLVNAEMPGIKKEDIHVEIDANQVTISAESKREKDVKDGERVLRSERYSGKVYRSFALAQDVDEAGANAKFENGVLQLTLPKKAASKAKLLAVN
jgi:HSP20 family protein